ncbi:arsenate reductase family protein [Pseudooctadecabacter sp.]|uniref:arsenate reductase family protein n=1 Tax=Pseudooctadecabacter sp. TaxID=1966338 RepID=UPI0035C8491F
MRFFGLKTCDTCRKALKALDGQAVEVIDVRADGVSDADRAAMVAAFGETVINKRSTTWRGLSEVEQSLDLDTLLKKHPTLLKRPVIDRDGVWLQGWTDDTKRELGVN